MKENKQKPWNRLLNESTLAFNAFATYRDLGPTRSYSKVRLELNKKEGYQRQIELWSSRYEWVKRATLYDDHLDNIKLSKAEGALKEVHDYAISRSKEVIDSLVAINTGDSWCDPHILKSYEVYFKAISLIK